MRALLRLGVAALAAVAVWCCATANGAPSLRILAAGDTAKLYISWSADTASHGTGYQLTVTVSASNGTWTGLPTALATTGTTAQVAAVSTTADSGSFVACLRSVRGTTVSAGQTCSTAKQWKRAPLTPPTAVSIDSVQAPPNDAHLFVSWTAAPRATGYVLSYIISATNGTWTNAAPRVVTSGATVAWVSDINSTTADSALFVACLHATTATQTSRDSTCSAPRQWKRALLPPPVVTIDSAVGVVVVPQGMKAYASRYAVPAGTVALPFSAGSLYVTPVAGIYSSRLQFCPLVQFAGDTVGLPAGYNFPPCSFIWQDSTTWAAVKPWHAPRAGQQAVADDACWQWTSTAGRYVTKGYWQPPGWTTPAESTAVFRQQLVIATLVDCAGAAPGSTFGRRLDVRPRLVGRVAIR